MDTQNTSLNTRASEASRGRVRNRQVVLSEQGRTATRTFLEGDRDAGEPGSAQVWACVLQMPKKMTVPSQVATQGWVKDTGEGPSG